MRARLGKFYSRQGSLEKTETTTNESDETPFTIHCTLDMNGWQMGKHRKMQGKRRFVASCPKGFQSWIASSGRVESRQRCSDVESVSGYRSGYLLHTL